MPPLLLLRDVPDASMPGGFFFFVFFFFGTLSLKPTSAGGGGAACCRGCRTGGGRAPGGLAGGILAVCCPISDGDALDLAGGVAVRSDAGACGVGETPGGLGGRATGGPFEAGGGPGGVGFGVGPPCFADPGGEGGGRACSPEPWLVRVSGGPGGLGTAVEDVPGGGFLAVGGPVPGKVMQKGSSEKYVILKVRARLSLLHAPAPETAHMAELIRFLTWSSGRRWLA